MPGKYLMLLELYMSLITTSNLEHRVGDKRAYREADHMSRTRDKYPSHSNVQGQVNTWCGASCNRAVTGDRATFAQNELSKARSPTSSTWYSS